MFSVSGIVFSHNEYAINIVIEDKLVRLFQKGFVAIGGEDLYWSLLIILTKGQYTQQHLRLQH